MRNAIQKELKNYLAKRMKQARKEKNLSQLKMAELLQMDTRSYSDIENGKSLCGTVTFICFLLFVADSIDKEFSGIAVVIEKVKDNAA